MYCFQTKVAYFINALLYLTFIGANVNSANIPNENQSQSPLLIRLLDLTSSGSKKDVAKEKNESLNGDFKVDESQKDEYSSNGDIPLDTSGYKSDNWKYNNNEWPAGISTNTGGKSMDKDDADLAALYKYYESQRPFHDPPANDDSGRSNKEYHGKDYNKEYNIPSGPVEMPVDQDDIAGISDGAQYYSDEPKYGSNPVRGGSLGADLTNARSDGLGKSNWRWDQSEGLGPRWDSKYGKFHGRNHDVVEKIHKGKKDTELAADGGLGSDVYHRDEHIDEAGQTGKNYKHRSGGKQSGNHHEEAEHHSKSSHTRPFDSRDSWKGW